MQNITPGGDFETPGKFDRDSPLDSPDSEHDWAQTNNKSAAKTPLDQDDPENLAQQVRQAKRLNKQQTLTNQKRKERFGLHPTKSLARQWIEGLDYEIRDGRFDKSRLNFPIQEDVQQYVDEISCKIRTSYLYNIKKNCSTNQLGEFCPVLVSLVDNNFIDQMSLKGHDLIKVFHKSGVCVYQRAIADQMLKLWRIFQDNLLLRVQSDVYYDSTTKKDPLNPNNFLSMQVEVLTLVRLSYDRQTRVQKIFCLEFPSMQFVHDFAFYKGDIYLLQKKPIEDSDQFKYNLVVLSPKETQQVVQAQAPKFVRKATLKERPNKRAPIQLAQKQKDCNEDEQIKYVEYIKKKEYTYDFLDLVPEGSMPFQDCGYPYYEKDGKRKVNEQVVLLVRDTNIAIKSAQIRFKEIVLNSVESRTELKSVVAFGASGIATQQVQVPILTGGDELEDTSRNLFLKNNRINTEHHAEQKNGDDDQEIVKIIHGMFRETNDLSETEANTNKIFNVTVLMRKQTVDFYYNYKYLSTLYNEAEDIELTFEDLYLKLKAPDFKRLKSWTEQQQEALLDIWVPLEKRGEDGSLVGLTDNVLQEVSQIQARKVKLCSIQLLWKSQISSNVLKVNDNPMIEEYWKKLTQIKVKDYVRFYNCFCQEKTFVFVSHDRFVSVYNMSTEKWIFHEDMEDEVRELWNIEEKEGVGKRESGFVLHLRCVVGAGTIKKLKFLLPAYSKDKASGTQPQITVKNTTMQDTIKQRKKISPSDQGSMAVLGFMLKQLSFQKEESSKIGSATESKRYEPNLSTQHVDRKKSPDRASFQKIRTSAKSSPGKKEKVIKSLQTILTEMSLRSIRSACISSLHPDSVVAIVETAEAEKEEEKQENSIPPTQILRFLKDPVRAWNRGNFLDEQDVEILNNPMTKQNNENFLYHSMTMECVRRNPYTFEERDPKLVLVAISKDAFTVLHLLQGSDDDFDSKTKRTSKPKEFKLTPETRIVTDAFNAGDHKVITIYLFQDQKMIQYMLVEEHMSIYRYRILETTIPIHRRIISKELLELQDFEHVVFAQQKRASDELKRIKKWITAGIKYFKKPEDCSAQEKQKLEDNYANQEKYLTKFDEKENEFIFVVEGRVINAIKFESDKGEQGMYLKYQSYNMNIVAAQDIDNFLYCLCKSHIKEIDGVPINQCEGGVYVYAIQQMQENQTDFSVALLQAHIGANRNLFVDKSRKRFMYMRDYDNLMQMPIVHTNIIAFAGMPDLRGRTVNEKGQVNNKTVYEILVFRVIDQKFYALTTEEEIYEWEITTGKLIQVVKMADLRTLYYCLTKDPVQHFEEYSIQLLIEKEEHVLKGEKDFSNDPNNRGTKGIVERNFRILKMSKDQTLPECEVVNHFQFKLQISSPEQRRTYKMTKKAPQQKRESLNSSQKDDLEPQNVSSLADEFQEIDMPQIKFSPDIRRMLLVASTGKCTIYELNLDVPQTQNASKIKIVEWRPVSFINDLQQELLWRTRQLYLFTPDFSHYIDYHYNRKQWIVKPTKSSAVDQDEYIPEDFLNTVFKDQDPNKKSPEFIASRMYLASQNHLRIINGDGVDCVYNIKTKQLESFCKVPGMEVGRFFDNHYYFDKYNTIKYENLAQMDSVTQRVISLNNEFIQASALKAELFDDQLERQWQACYSKEFIKQAVSWELYMNHISKVSYVYDKKINFQRFYAEKSFVLLDWLIIEKIFSDPKFIKQEFSQIPKLQQLRICYNILPNQKSLMHRLANDSTLSDSSEIARRLFSICNSTDISGLDNQKHQMPFFTDAEDNNPFDYVLQIHKRRKDESEEKLGSFNKNLALVLFDEYKNHEFMSLGRSIARAIPEAIVKECSGVAEFMNNRMFLSEHLWPIHFMQNTLRQGMSNSNILYTNIEEGIETKRYAQTAATSPWPSRKLLEKDLFYAVQGDDTKTKQIDVQLSTRYIDIPCLHNSYRKESRDFISALSQSNSLDLFSTHAVQSIIAHRWRSDFTLLIWGQLVPYIIYQLVFVFYNGIVLSDIEAYAEAFNPKPEEGLQRLLRGGKSKIKKLSDGEAFTLGLLERFDKHLDWLYSPSVYFGSMACLALFSVYFFYMGLMMLIRTKNIFNMQAWDIIISISNFFLPSALLLIFLGFQIKKGITFIDPAPLNTFERQILSYSSITLWFNLLYFARMSESIGLYIILFRQFISGIIKYIILIVVFVIIAADYFRVIGSANTKIDPITKETYPPPFDSLYNSVKYSIFWGLLAQDDLSSIKDSDSEIFLVVVWFILSLLIALIILNLLVAVIGWLFESVLQNYVASNQMAKAQLLSSVQNISLSVKKDTSIVDKFLVTVFYPSLENENEERKESEKASKIEFEEEKTSDSESNDEGHSIGSVTTAKKSKTLRQSTSKEMA